MTDYDALASSLGGLDLKGIVKQQSEALGLPADFVSRLVQQESGFNPSAVGPMTSRGVQARGLMQLVPDTAKMLGVSNVFDPMESLRGGLKHLKYLSDKYHGDQRLIAAAYNAGEGAVDQHGGVPPFPETQRYVQIVANPDPDQVAKDLGGVDYDGLAKQFGGEEQKPNAGDTKKNENLNKYAEKNPSLWQRVVARASHPLDTATDLAIGAGKGALSTAVSLGNAALNAPVIGPALQRVNEALGSGTPAEQLATFPEAQRRLAASNTVQKIGGGLEQAAEFAIPAGRVAKGATLLTKGAPMIVKMGAQALGQGGVGYGVAKLHGDNPTVGAVAGALGGAATPVIDAAVPALRALSTKMGVSALLPKDAIIKNMPGGLSVDAPEQMKRLANYVLENKLTLTTVNKLLKQYKTGLDDALSNAGQVSVDAVASILGSLQRIEQTYGGSAIPRDLEMLINKATSAMTPADAYALAQKMKIVNQGNWGVTGGVAKETGKAIEADLRSSVKAIPEVNKAVDGYGMAVVAKKALNDANKRIDKRMPVSPFTLVAAAVGFPHAVATFGASEILALGSHVLHKYPLQSAQVVRNLSEALAAKNVPLVSKMLMRLGLGAATDMTRGAGAPTPPVQGGQ